MLFFYSLQPQLFGNCREQTAVETQQGEKDLLTYAVEQYGFNTVLMLRSGVFWGYGRAEKMHLNLLRKS